MSIETILITINLLHSYLKAVTVLVYDRCGFELTNLKLDFESIEYGACSFRLNGKSIQHRVSKITPTKAGQFVTIWKRNKEGITAPFNFLDDVDFIIITSKCGENFGQFIFPKSILTDKKIIARNGVAGKRGIRVYPPWDFVTSKQAAKTQDWQSKYFITIKNDNTTDLDLIQQLIKNEI